MNKVINDLINNNRSIASIDNDGNLIIESDIIGKIVIERRITEFLISIDNKAHNANISSFAIQFKINEKTTITRRKNYLCDFMRIDYVDGEIRFSRIVDTSSVIDYMNS